MNACATCGSTMGFFKGPNGYARCLFCMHDQDFKELPDDPNVSPEPNQNVDPDFASSASDVSVMTTQGTVRDKATDGPKASSDPVEAAKDAAQDLKDKDEEEAKVSASGVRDKATRGPKEPRKR